MGRIELEQVDDGYEDFREPLYINDKRFGLRDTVVRVAQQPGPFSSNNGFGVRVAQQPGPVPMLKSFAGSMVTDLKEILIACGYGVKGSFKYIDEVQGSTGLLLSMIEFDINLADIKVINASDFWGNPTIYRAEGSVTVDGKISLELVGSPVSEILSKKIMTIGPVLVDVTSDQVYDGRIRLNDSSGGFRHREMVERVKDIVRNDRVHSDLERTLKTQYDEVMSTIYHHFNSNEFAKLVPKIEPPRMNLIFDYTPKKTSVGSTDITFAIVNTHFETPVSMFKDFAENMTKDFQEIFTSNGYRIKGPFKNHDEMTYSDKEGSDLVLMANVDFNPDFSQLKWTEVEVKFESQEEEKYYKASGLITINCAINLLLYESLTKELLWTKQIAITPLVVPLLSHEKYASKANLEGQLKEDNQLHADLGKALQSQYNEIMGKIEVYLDPREMEIIAKQAQKLRKMKVFE